MKFLVAVLASSLLAPSVVSGGDFLDTFTYPDGTFPPEWTWTGDPRGGGAFLVQGEAFVHIGGGHVHYFRPGEVAGYGEYEFEYRDGFWTYAWRISPGNPNSGRCLFLHPGFAFGEFEWTTLGGYPEGQYMYHNGSFTRRVYNTYDPGPGSHHVRIVDQCNRVQIYVDGDPIFDEPYEPIPDGYVGLGSDSGSGAGFPSFDNVAYTWTLPRPPRTWRVPSECPSIQAGIDSTCAGDTVLVAPGTYNETVRLGNNVVLKSEVGAKGTIIDALGAGTGLTVQYCGVRIEGFTITGGNDTFGGGVRYDGLTGAEMVNCRIVNNTAWNGAGFDGGHTSFFDIIGCLIADNVSTNHAGGIMCYGGGGLITLRNCTIVGNTTPGHGGGVCQSTEANVAVENCIIVNNSSGTGGGGVYADAPSWITITCSDVWNNTVDDYHGCGPSTGCFSENPLFCNGCYYLQACSFCVDGYGCGLVGAYGVGCPCGGGPTVMQQSSWSSLKALYR